jgi:hypothetical protein
LWGGRSASQGAAATAVENALPPATAVANLSTWTLGQEIPFGPSLALGGFLYYAWPWLHQGVNQYLELVRDTFLGS